jgi:hypothetical protein
MAQGSPGFPSFGGVIAGITSVWAMGGRRALQARRNFFSATEAQKQIPGGLKPARNDKEN